MAFKRSLAVVIGINEYQNYPKLQTARYDAERLVEILATEHNYDHIILVVDDTYKEYSKGQELPVKNKYQPTLDGLLNLLVKRLSTEINPTQEDRLLFYFAGHGVSCDSDEGPKGYLVPLDADSRKLDSLLQMHELYKRLAALNCRHFLIILDCCFAGSFRWSSTRKGRTSPKAVYKEHYDRFINSPAWQAITSASHDQEALDTLGDNRGIAEGTNHSPFAEELFKALQGAADSLTAGKNGQPAGDGVITATELYTYLRNHVEPGSKERQTPGLWPLPKHDRGEYIFLVPGANLNLKPAPKVNEKNNSYRGLQPFEEEHAQFFFGREEIIQQLFERISAPEQPLTVVLGVSGSGKSSLVKAGLIPRLKNTPKLGGTQANPVHTFNQWHILNPMRPGDSPFTALAKTILALADVTDSNQPDTLNFLNVSPHLDNVTFLNEVLEQKVNALKVEANESSSENGEESAETLRLQEEVDEFNLMIKRWKEGTKKAKQLLIVEHFEELYNLCQNSAEKQQLQQAVADCLNPLSSRLQSDPDQLINIVKAWSQKNPGVGLLLTIDQFEELITLSQSKQKDKQNDQEEWQKFLNLIEKTLSANLDGLRIIVTLRSDFEPRFLNLDALKSYWQKARFSLRAMRTDELRQAIERPASEMALYFEPPNLVDRLIDEVGQMPGALPLLSFTLSELYIKLAEKWRTQETSDRALVLDADFDKQGGVAGSLTRRANEEYDNLPNDAHRATLRRVMLRMVTTEGGESARRRVPLSELEYADAAENERVKLVLERFNLARLIVSGQETGEPYVEPAHDFLVKSWDKLQKWQQEEQQNLPLQRRLTPTALEWKNKEQPASVLARAEHVWDWCDKRIDSVIYLWNEINKKGIQELRRERKGQFLWNGNPHLDVLKKRLKYCEHWFNQVETEFVQKSVWRRRRNVNLLLGSTISVVLGLSVLTFFALLGQSNALIGQIRANRQSAESNLRSNQEFDALLESLRAGKSLKQPFLQLFKPDSQIQNQLKETLQKAVYQVKERNRLNGGDNASAVNISFSPDGQHLATVGDDGTVRLRNLQGQLLKEWNTDPRANMSFSPNGQLLATAAASGIVRLWDLQGQPLKEWKADTSWLGVSFSPDGQILATAGGSGIVRLWNLQGQLLKEWKVSPYPLRSVSISRDSQLLATAGDDGIPRLWNLQGQLLAKLKKNDSNTIYNTSVSFSPNGQTLATPGEDGTVGLWNLQGQFLAELKGNQGVVTNVSFSRGGQLLATAGSSDTVHLWDLQGHPLTELKGHQKVFKSISFNPDGQRLTTVGENGTVGLWNLQGQLLKELQGNEHKITSVSFSPDRQRFVTAGTDGIARLWNLQGQLLKELHGNERKITSVSFIPNGQQLATIEEDGTVRLWNSMTGQSLVKFPRKLSNDSLSPDGRIAGFSPDGQRLVTIKDYDYVHLWNWQGQDVAKARLGHRDGVSSFGFSPGNKLLATAGQDGLVRVWKLQGQPLTEQLSHWQAMQGVILKLKFSPDGQQLATAGDDDTVRLWDLQGQPLATWKVDQGQVSIIKFSPDGQQLATAGSSGNAKLWRIESFNELMQRGCDWVRDYLTTLDEKNSDRHLCDDIPPSTPSPQATAASPSAPSVQPSAQNAPSPALSSNNGQNSYGQASNNRNQVSRLNFTSVNKYISQGLIYDRQKNYQ